jgi:hypothetical protein
MPLPRVRPRPPPPFAVAGYAVSTEGTRRAAAAAAAAGAAAATTVDGASDNNNGEAAAGDDNDPRPSSVAGRDRPARTKKVLDRLVTPPEAGEKKRPPSTAAAAGTAGAGASAAAATAGSGTAPVGRNARNWMNVRALCIVWWLYGCTCAW